jgi:tetratricopeptide (TPR) repeat protein
MSCSKASGGCRAAEFLYEAQLSPDLEYTFKHALTHEVAHGGLLQHRRQAVHARVTEVLERLYADRLADYVELLAHHALRAELWDKAVMYLSKAGRRAVQRSAHRMAAAFFEEALTTLRHLPPTRATTELGIDLRLELRVPLAPPGGARRRLEVLREAQRSATDLDDQQRLALTLCHMIEPLVEVGEMNEAIEVGERAFELAQTLNDLGIRVLVLRYMARAHHRLGDYAKGIQSLRRSLELLGDLEREHFGAPLPSAVAARTWLAWCLAEVGEFAEGATVGREALRVAELVDQPLSRVHARFALGAVHLLRGELDHAITAFDHAVRLVRTWDIAGWFHRAGSSLALAYATAGRLAEALPLLEVIAKDNWTS